MEAILSYDVAIFLRIMSCYKNHMTAHEITLWRVHVTSLTTALSTMCFHSNNVHFKGYKMSYDKQNLTLMVISYEIYEIRRRFVS